MAPDQPGLFDETLTVSRLAGRVQGALDDAFAEEVWVEGELSGLRRSERGHVYFSLVEPGDLGAPPVATIPVALFEATRRAVNARLRRTGGVRMTDGMAVRIRGRLDFYAPQGRLQLRMTGIDPLYTLGRLAAERERVLQLLVDEGLHLRNGRLPLPRVPLRVGLVTASASAAYADFVHELERSGLGFRVLHTDARMQGREAEGSVVRALRALDRRDVDVVALVRGGGARSDLATFDSEAVARAIAGLRVPVLTGIGHEVDDSVADRVAHQAHKTPTACATSLVERVLSFRRELDDGARQLRAAAAGRLDQAERRVGALGGTITGLARTAVDTAQVRLTHGAEQLVRGAGRPLDRADAAATIRADRLPAEARRGLRDRERDLDHRAAQLRVLDPDRLLARGWTITRTADGEPLRTIDRLEPGTRLLTTFADGEARSTVDAIETATQEGAGHGH